MNICEEEKMTRDGEWRAVALEPVYGPVIYETPPAAAAGNRHWADVGWAGAEVVGAAA